MVGVLGVLILGLMSGNVGYLVMGNILPQIGYVEILIIRSKWKEFPAIADNKKTIVYGDSV